MSSQARRPIFRAGFVACLIASAIFSVWWMNEAIPYITDGPRDIQGIEGWWNIALDVGIKVFLLGLMHTLPPWLLLLVLVRVATGPGFSQGFGVQPEYTKIVGTAYVVLATVTGLVWCIGAPLGVWFAIHFVLVFSPGFLLLAWWALRKTVVHVATAKA